ncbi:hypothetical protein BUALT_Bualt13G0009900 [Buddleja alternifolia]|uniref:Uncharacterized protein n=1 Tax=Buddleja alternifolia TaxID=168488 RepID=A0AAV6WJD2_9LAMI|nr:hypothetical protein BUALT_Bualt13G0009900 [Buddleja alternifolia]
MEKNTTQQSKRQPGSATHSIELWSVQCHECFKWRLIPTQEEYEEIRSKITQHPFVCTKKPGISCENPADIEYDNSRTWVIDKPDLPKTPKGFKRKIVLRKDFSKMDCYYDTPTGKRLRSSTEVPKYLDENPEYKKDVSVQDFSFSRPKIMEDTLPINRGKE